MHADPSHKHVDEFIFDKNKKKDYFFTPTFKMYYSPFGYSSMHPQSLFSFSASATSPYTNASRVLTSSPNDFYKTEYAYGQHYTSPSWLSDPLEGRHLNFRSHLLAPALIST